MRPIPVFVLLWLFVCTAALAAPPVITPVDSGANARVTVLPGHRIAWIKEGSPEVSGMTADSDGDGVIDIVSGTNNIGVWVVADVETGEWAYWYKFALTFQPIGAGKILRDPAGNYTQVALLPNQRTGGGVWVRPGVGAWGGANGSWPFASVTTLGDAVMISNVEALVPLGSSPSRPAGFSHGDVLLLVGGTAQSGVVDAALDAPPSPGTVLFNTSGTISTLREGATVMLDVVRLDGTSGTIAVDYGIDAPAGLEAGVDYPVLDSPTITFAPGETVKKLALTFPNDSIYSAFDRTMTLSLQEPAGGATIGSHSAQTVQLLENDPPPTLVFGTLPASVEERDAPWTLEVPWSVNGEFRGSAEVAFSAGSTYATTTVTPGDTQRVSPIAIAADDVPSPARTLDFRLTSSFSEASATISIVDDDPPAWTTTDLVLYERRFTAENFRFTLAQAPAGAASVTFHTTDGTATAGQDYTAAAGTASFFDTAASVEMRLQNDSLNEGNETFHVDVTGTSGPIQPPPRTRYTVTIVDDDVPPPPLSMSAQPVVEGHSGTTPAPIVVRLASPATTNVVLDLRAAATGTVNSGDYTLPLPAEIEFLLGEIEKSISVHVRGDYAVEQDETFHFEAVSRATGAVVATTSLTVLNDDRQSFISVADVAVDESLSEATFLITFSQSPGSAGSFRYATANGTATAGSDYTGASGTIAFGPDDTQKEVRVPLLEDTNVEADETFTLKLSGLSAPTGIYLHKDVATATIRDNDTAGAPVITLSATPPLEGNSGSRSMPLLVHLAAAAPAAVDVAIVTQPGTAGAGTDYVPLSTGVTFHPGETEKELSIDILGDTAGETDETFTVAASYDGAVAAVLTITIRDDDTAYYVAVSDTSVVEGTGRSSTASFRVMFLPPPPNGGTVRYETEHDTATAGDYAPVRGTLSFAAGETGLTIPVEVFGDATAEKDERFRMRLSDPTGGLLLFDAAGIATIYDDDGPIVRPTLSMEDAAVSETNA
ncbi:MAG TPA: Calx-beta domain-containing protein, partial [Thermoanaerobaculia bacterium]|nr:Calx-beta domain-containing protein [Thermoanaerobaculia bacterium]